MRVPATTACLYLLFTFIGVFTLMTLAHYPGRAYVYLIFSILINALLFLGLRPGSLFFDTFLGGLLWLGYWLKFSFRTVVFDGKFHDAVGHFDYSADAYDKALLVTSCGIAGFLAARLIRERLLFNSLGALKNSHVNGIRAVYAKYGTLAWLGFCLLVISVTLTNIYFGIYQRGSVPRTVLPFGLGGIYTWLLLFGASSISAVLLNCDMQLRHRISCFLVLLALAETFLSNTSMLSRGMIINASAILLGTYMASRAHGILLRARAVLMTAAALSILFAGSIFAVTQLRSGFSVQEPIMAETVKKFEVSPKRAQDVAKKSIVLFIDRWVGMEGILAVTSYPGLGWDLWDEAWKEKYSDRGTSLYDRKIAESVYTLLDLSNRHFVSMAGVLGFFFYPGSFGFLFLSMLTLGLLGGLIEAAVYRWGGGNIILCSLMGLVVAYRYAHFGYAPARSYLLFGAIVLNVLMIYVLNRLLEYKGAAAKLAARADVSRR